MTTQSAHKFNLVLVDPKQALCDAWSLFFADLPRVSIHHGKFEELTEYDCMVSAANSFGLMDGGVDLAITSYFGIELMDRVQQAVIDEYRGEQPVGTSMIVETGHAKHPYIAHTPTMRKPMRITKTDNVYAAMFAMLCEVWRFNRREPVDKMIRTVACPGLGTACGGMQPEKAAKHMSLAYYNFLDPPKQISWPYAEARQTAIGAGGDGKY
ncbi:MAG: macro domain-containing protein [Phycisphaeraceae bacterium]